MTTRSAALDKHIRHAAALVCGAPSLNSLDGELRRLIDICYDESWQQSETMRDPRGKGSVTDFRVRKCIKMMSESPGAEIELDTIARASQGAGSGGRHDGHRTRLRRLRL